MNDCAYLQLHSFSLRVHSDLKTEHLHHRCIKVDPVSLQRCHSMRRDRDSSELVFKDSGLRSRAKRGKSRRCSGRSDRSFRRTSGIRGRSSVGTDKNVFILVNVHRRGGRLSSLLGYKGYGRLSFELSLKGLVPV